MIRLTEIKLPLDHDDAQLRAAVLHKLSIGDAQLRELQVFRRGYDARRRSDIHFVYTLDVDTDCNAQLLAQHADDRHVQEKPDTDYHFVTKATADFAARLATPAGQALRPVVIGLGPCGLFAGLLLAQMGFRPIILERGKPVRERTKDTWALWRKRKLDPESNVQFGEGGAGTFSDGKLHSQVKDQQQHGRKVLQEFVAAGAPEEILYVSKPHIGTFKLVTMIENMRHTIESLGGEIRFRQQVTDLVVETGDNAERQLRGVRLASGEVIDTRFVVLAVGHSARDTFEMLLDCGVYVEAKPFAVGFRMEHPQGMVDRCRFGDFAGHPLLGAADYKLVHHASNGRDVYSFCMCPGGTVVAATSEEGRVVTNGMSQYSRNERNANSAIVVGITPEDCMAALPPGTLNSEKDRVLAGMHFQRMLESRAYELGVCNYNAPAQLIGDFLAGKPSSALGSVEPSYRPGVTPTDLSHSLPDYAIAAIREALPAFDRQMRGYAMHDAVMTGVETRTSSPVRIKRNARFESLNTHGLYPAGEGAGYAGGILSAGIDGIKVAEAVALAIDLELARQVSA